MESLIIATGVVFVAELGDKTQLVAMSLATRHRFGVVLAGVALAFALTQGLAALLGGVLGAALPDTAIGIGAGILFLGFAVWTWLDADDEEDVAADLVTTGGFRALMAVLLAMSLAEMGDKTMLATTTLAADRDPFLSWIGATIGGTAAAALGVVVGRVLGARLPVRATKRLAAVLFALFGVLVLIDAVR
jgi:putative Ca2+/H+ antiporter (TMEM165/GDT1 family)